MSKLPHAIEFVSPFLARVYMEKLVNDGEVDFFRGQNVDWMPIPSVFRKPMQEQEKAIVRLEEFASWCLRVPQMAGYKDLTQIVAIAQHYGIDTNYLDITSSIDVALFFAFHNCKMNQKDYSVIFCTSKKKLSEFKGINLIHINVPNLWRLESQQGSFIEFKDDAPKKDETLNIWTHVLFIQQMWNESDIDIETIYPKNKSNLERQIDLYLERQEHETLFSKFTVIAKRYWVSYPGAFKRRKIPDELSEWAEMEKVWQPNLIVPLKEKEEIKLILKDFETTMSPKEIFEQVSNSVRTAEEIGFLKAYTDINCKLTSKKITKVQVSLLEKSLSNYYDYIVDAPLTRETKRESIALLLTLIKRNLNSKISFKDFILELLGETLEIGFAGYGGPHQYSLLSEQRLLKCIDFPLDSLNLYWQTKCKYNKLFLLNFCLEYKSLLNPSKFVELFFLELLPIYYALNVTELLDLKADVSQLNSLLNPFHLGYIASYEYVQMHIGESSPSIDDYIFLFSDMDEQHIKEDVVAAITKHKVDETLFKCRMSGFDKDKRELWEIPEAKSIATYFVKYIGCSVLIPFSNVETAKEFYSPEELKIAKISQPLGAFEMWLIYKGINANLLSNENLVKMVDGEFRTFYEKQIELMSNEQAT